MSTNNIDLFSYMPGLEVTENELLEAELLSQQILTSKFPDIDLREGTALRDLVIRPSATLLALINKALVFYFQNNTLDTVNNQTPQTFVDSVLSNWFLTRKIGRTAVLSVRIYFSKAKNINLFQDIFFSTDGVLKFSPLSNLSFISTQLIFDAGSNQYYVDVDLAAEKAGVEYNITTGSLLYFTNFDPYFLHAEINYLKEVATDVETNLEFVARAKDAISTRNLINSPSISSNLLSTFGTLDGVSTKGFGAPEMVRDQIQVMVPGVADPIWIHNGGMVDTYCRVPLASSIVQLTTDSNGKVLITGAVRSFERSLIPGGTSADVLPLYLTKTVSSLTSTGTVATATTSSAHGYTTGQIITMAGAVPSGYNLTIPVTVTSSNTFTYAVVSGLTSPATGTITSGIPVPYTWKNNNLLSVTPDSITRSGGEVTVTSENHGIMVGERVSISGADQSDYNGVFLVDSVPDRDTFTFATSATPATPATGSLNLSYVTRVSDVGFSDRQSILVDFGNSYPNQTVSFSLDFFQDLDGIQDYLEDPTNRVVCADLLARGFNVTMLDLTIVGYNGPAPDSSVATKTVTDYLSVLAPGAAFIMGDLIANLTIAGITTIQTPIGVTYTKYWRDLLGTTTGTITDTLLPRDSTNLFVLNSITTLNQVIT